MIKQDPVPTYILKSLPDDYDPTNQRVDLRDCIARDFRFFSDGRACCLAYPLTSFTFSNDAEFIDHETGDTVTAKQIRESHE